MRKKNNGSLFIILCIALFLLLPYTLAQGEKKIHSEHIKKRSPAIFGRIISKRLDGTKNNKKAGRKTTPAIEDAAGPHTVLRYIQRRNRNELTGYQTYYENKNRKNPNKWIMEKRVDITGSPHKNKKTDEMIHAPHVHDNLTPGGVRHARPDELPKRKDNRSQWHLY